MMSVTSSLITPSALTQTMPDLLDREAALTTKEFFDLILPGAGLRCVVHIHRKRAIQTFHLDNQAAATKAAALDGTGVGDVYFACAAFRDQGSREAINAQAAQSMWLDLDTAEFKGEGNAPYANRQVALSELERFCFELALPTPVVISSGYGLHVYWPMDAPLSPDEWRETAHALKGTCDNWGLKADHSRTTDIASILRVPGTHNRKNSGAPQRVKIL